MDIRAGLKQGLDCCRFGFLCRRSRFWVFCFEMKQTCNGNMHQSSSGSFGCLFIFHALCAHSLLFCHLSLMLLPFTQTSYFSCIHWLKPVHKRARPCMQPLPYMDLGKRHSFSWYYTLKPHIPWYLGQQKSSLEKKKIKSKTTLLQFPKILWLCHEVIHRILWKIWFNVTKMQRRS